MKRGVKRGRKSLDKGYRDRNKDRINAKRREQRRENHDELNEKRREQRRENHDELNKKRREQCNENRDEINAKRRKQYHDNCDELNKKRRQQWNENHDNAKQRQRRHKKQADVAKATFSTCVSELPLDTTQYEFEQSPENGVMNWYMLASDGWRYEWDYEIYRENINSTDIDKQELAKEHLDRLLKTIEAQKITPERQKRLASQFYEDLGRGGPWGNHAKFDEDEHGPSIDAWLFGCASCGFRDYCIQNAYRTYHRVDLGELAILKLDSDELTLYQSQKNIVVCVCN